jgi:hypothetical protein
VGGTGRRLERSALLSWAIGYVFSSWFVYACMHACVVIFTFLVEGEIYKLQWLWRRSEVVGE